MGAYNVSTPTRWQKYGGWRDEKTALHLLGSEAVSSYWSCTINEPMFRMAGIACQVI
jgi:hypothetical protein